MKLANLFPKVEEITNFLFDKLASCIVYLSVIFTNIVAFRTVWEEFSFSYCTFLCFRGKCLVTLYNEAEVLPKYLEKEVCFCDIKLSNFS